MTKKLTYKFHAEQKDQADAFLEYGKLLGDKCFSKRAGRSGSIYVFIIEVAERNEIMYRLKYVG